MHIDVARVRAALHGRDAKPASRVGDERFAAVAAILREREERAEVLLIRRAEHDGDPWSGHMAFPGGRHDPADLDLVDTAIRETREEVGLELRRADAIGRLDDFQAVARGRRIAMIIAPFVFHLPNDAALSVNPREVTEAVWTPLEPLANGERDTTMPYRFANSSTARRLTTAIWFRRTTS